MESQGNPRWLQAAALPTALRGATGIAASPPADETSLESLLRTFQLHIDAETETVRSYRRLATTAADPAVALLMHLLVEDEDRHHALLQQMATRLRDALEWTHSPQALPTTAVPPVLEQAGDAVSLLAHIREEQKSAKHLRALAKQYANLYGGLFALLLEMMALDSEKHARILRFVYQRLVCKV